jgi:hypothetical protein
VGVVVTETNLYAEKFIGTRKNEQKLRFCFLLERC